MTMEWKIKAIFNPGKNSKAIMRIQRSNFPVYGGFHNFGTVK
jgi:hypothetical protein